jgi:hypothetical protein
LANFWGSPRHCRLWYARMKVLASARWLPRRLAFVAGMATSADAYYYTARTYRSYYQPPATFRQLTETEGVGQTTRRKRLRPIRRRTGFVDIPKTGVLQIAISIGSSASRSTATAYASPSRGLDRTAQQPDADGGVQRHREGPFPPLESLRQRTHVLHAAQSPGRASRCTRGCCTGYASLARLHPVCRCDFAARLWPTTKLGRARHHRPAASSRPSTSRIPPCSAPRRSRRSRRWR